jgi:uncharacterized protein with GYD domain
MTDQDKLDDLHARVGAWNDKAEEQGIPFNEMVQTPEFASLLVELMELPTDDLMVMIGMAIQDAGEMPDWLTELPESDI